jgi:crotonobetainyl-CoA:carnitine CoA-transferase CaiB-like acyl-CoA transferase
MRLGDVANEGAQHYGKPLDGVRVLAAEQMQALPYATQLLARLGADVVKVEHPVHGESGRASTPAMRDPEGRAVGATYLRNNFNKRSVGIDLKLPEGRDLFLALVPKFDVVAENFKPGTMDRMGLGYDAIAQHAPRAVYVSISGFGNTVETPYRDWPAYASIVEAMSGIYDYRHPEEPPVTIPVGALGDISSALFGVIGIMAALRHRDHTGEGQYVDIAMFDAMLAMTDIVTNFWSLGLKSGTPAQLINHGFRAKDGWFVMQVGREAQFAKLVALIGHPEWKDDPRFATRGLWLENLDSVLRPAIEGWASTLTRIEACDALGPAGIAAGPCFVDEEVVVDPHLQARHMLVEMPRTDGVEQPVLIPGNPVKLSGVAEGPETRVPWLGEHTAEVLAAELGLSGAEIDALRADGVVS